MQFTFGLPHFHMVIHVLIGPHPRPLPPNGLSGGPLIIISIFIPRSLRVLPSVRRRESGPKVPKTNFSILYVLLAPDPRYPRALGFAEAVSTPHFIGHDDLLAQPAVKHTYK
jgi:hypothetical protein